MVTRSEIREMAFNHIAGGEGFRSAAYMDPSGKGSNVGYGSSIGIFPDAYRRAWAALHLPEDFEAVLQGKQSISRESAKKLTMHWIKNDEATIKKYIPGFEDLPTSVQVALSDIAYQCGGGTFGPTGGLREVAQAINGGDYKRAASYLVNGSNHWYNRWSGGKRAEANARLIAAAQDGYTFDLAALKNEYGASPDDEDDEFEAKIDGFYHIESPQEDVQERVEGRELRLRDKTVANWQRDLVELGYDLGNFKDKNGNATGVDGRFGPVTEKAVKKFQHDHGLKETGKLDATTKDAIEKALEERRKEKNKPKHNHDTDEPTVAEQAVAAVAPVAGQVTPDKPAEQASASADLNSPQRRAEVQQMLNTMSTVFGIDVTGLNVDEILGQPPAPTPPAKTDTHEMVHAG